METECSQLQKELQSAKAALQEELAKDPRSSQIRSRYDERGVREARRCVADLEEKISIAEDRVPALENLLPSDGEREAATEEAAKLVAQAKEAGDRYAATEPELFEALHALESVSGELSAAQRGSLDSIGAVSKLVARYGVDVDLPAVPGLSQGGPKQAVLGRLQRLAQRFL